MACDESRIAEEKGLQPLYGVGVAGAAPMSHCTLGWDTVGSHSVPCWRHGDGMKRNDSTGWAGTAAGKEEGHVLMGLAQVEMGGGWEGKEEEQSCGYCCLGGLAVEGKEQAGGGRM